MEEMNNFNQQPPTPTSPVPSIPPAHQMMGGMPMSTPTAAAGTSTFLQNFIAIFILIIGGGSLLYFTLNKNNSLESEATVNQVSGFDFDNNIDPVNGTTFSNETTTSTSTEPTEVVSVVGEVGFKCEDLFPAADMQKFTKDSKPVKVTTEKSIDRISCEYEQIENDDWQTLTHSYNVSIDFPYLNVTTSMLFEATKKSTTSLENLPNIGTEAFTGLLGGILRPVVVLSTNKKYVFWVSSTWDMGPQKTDKTYLKDIAKIVDINLSK